MGVLFSPYIKNKSGELRIKSTTMESKNIDLTILFENGEKLLIENKVKSIPNKNQLEIYIKENPNMNYLLLTLTQTNFDLGDWRILTYKELSSHLREIFDKINDDYVKYLLNDYTNFVDDLVKLTEHILIDFENDKFNFYNH